MARWSTVVIASLERLRQEDCMFGISLGPYWGRQGLTAGHVESVG